MKRLMLRDWCLGFALFLGCAQDFVLLFLWAARLCVKRLVLRGLVFTQDLVLLCLVGCKALCEEVGASGLVFRVCCSCGLCPGLCVIVFWWLRGFV